MAKNHVHTTHAEIVRRLRRAEGHLATVIDMIEIGAGGGSVAHVDALGLLKVGPESAGADPGPACYGRGGTEEFFNLGMNARYLRLQGIARATQYGYSLFEVEFKAPGSDNSLPTLTTSALSTGSHSLAATYSGDKAHQPSTSTASSVSVLAASSTSLSVSPSSVTIGQPVTLTSSDRAAVCSAFAEGPCGGSGNTFEIDDAHVKQEIALANLWVDLPVGGVVTPYLGGGAGLAHSSFNDEDKSRFVWQAGAGVAVAVSRSISLTADYRHRQVAATTFEEDGESVRVGKLKTNLFTAGLRFHF